MNRLLAIGELIVVKIVRGATWVVNRMIESELKRRAFVNLQEAREYENFSDRSRNK